MNNKIVTFILILSMIFPTVNAATNSVIIHPVSCSDSENNCQLSNVQTQDGVSESQKGHQNQIRVIDTVNGNTSAITSPDTINNVTVYIDRFESANPGGQTITLQVVRPSDNTASSCTLSAKLTNDSVYDG